MRGGALPSALLSAALGLGLASAEGRKIVRGLIVLIATACAIALAPIPGTWSDGVYMGCWVSIIASAAMVYSPWNLNDHESLALSLNAGVWTGAVSALEPTKIDLLEALPWALCVWPAVWARRRRGSIILKVLGSWLIAVAVLAATLQFLPVTPGYRPDHMD